MLASNLAESLDHFVVPVDDLIAAEEFYPRVFGSIIIKRNGLNVRQRKRGAVPHTFIQIGGKRMGVYLQSEEREQPNSPHGLPTYSFTTIAGGLDGVLRALDELGSTFDGPVQSAHSFAYQTVFFDRSCRQSLRRLYAEKSRYHLWRNKWAHDRGRLHRTRSSRY